MTGSPAALDRFIADWREPLEQQAGVLFATGALDAPSLMHTDVADRFVQSQGLRPIGANWEMLDPSGDDSAPRSAIAFFADALSQNMVLPRRSWLGEGRARQCGREFLACFEPRSRTILTNRMDFGWNPISAANVEWAFIGFDDQKIALLLLAAQD
ncbi:hypothetical protein [Pontixanthobacter luteolus]|uniref:hypothetical protein n=1 Tax=Pontixanthobacter luteolus TaxID=295089 RepID=UPI002303E37A|nr:hypothetical protein [Pontixanthobacter luteolus]